jgi:hypothetical protein
MTIFKRYDRAGQSLSVLCKLFSVVVLSQVFVQALPLTISLSPALAEATTPNPFTAQTQWTPVLIAPTFAPRPFAGGEGEWHLVYDVTLINYARHNSDLQKFEILGQGADGKWSVLKTLDAAEIKKNILLLSQSDASTTLAPGVASVLFVNIDFAGESAIEKVKSQPTWC